ncbi:aec77 [Escherichia coli]|nr:aec77 [Escherichia coli]
MMKLALTLEADSVNVQALNMGRIVVDIDGVNLAELINMVCDNGYSLRVVDESDRTSADCTPPFVALTGIRCSTAHITETDNAWLYSLSHQTSDFGESEWIHFTGTGYLLRSVVWSSHSSGVMVSASFIWMPVPDVCQVYPLSTGNPEIHNMKSLTTETALDILITWLQDNIDCESGIIFDNDEDKTDSAALLPCIEQAREGIRTLRQQ